MSEFVKCAVLRTSLAECVAAIFAFSASTTYANTLNVWNCGSEDFVSGSLAWAAANAMSTDTIAIAITDHSDCDHDVAADVLVQRSTLTFATGVTIQGPGTSKFAVSAQGVALQSKYQPIVGNGALTINDIAVVHGAKGVNNGTAYGGCIFAKGDLTLNRVYVSDCYAGGNLGTSSGKGGAVASLGAVTMSNSTISHSRAAAKNSMPPSVAVGGAIYARGDVVLNNSSISYSEVWQYGQGQASGGGIFSMGKVELNDSDVSGQAYVSVAANAALGGGIWSAGNTKLTLSTISGSGAGGATGRGGGIFSQKDVALYQSYIFQSGASLAGGGIYSIGKTTMGDSTIKANTSGVGGGVVAIGGIHAKYSSFAANHAANYGSAIVTHGYGYLRGVSVAENSSGACCAVMVKSGAGKSLVLYQSTISDNSSGSGAAGLYTKAETTALYNMTITGNHSEATAAPARVGFSAAGNAGYTLYMSSNLLSGNTRGAARVQDDFGADMVPSGDHNLITVASSSAPGGIIGGCARLYPGYWELRHLTYQWVVRHEIASSATDAGSNEKGFTSDQRGGRNGATSPPRESSRTGTGVADVGAYEIDFSDEIFDSRHEGCN